MNNFRKLYIGNTELYKQYKNNYINSIPEYLNNLLI